MESSSLNSHLYSKILFQVHLVIVMTLKALIIFFFAALDILQTGTLTYYLQTHSIHDLLHGKETATDEENQIMFLHVQDFIVKSKRFA